MTDERLSQEFKDRLLSEGAGALVGKHMVIRVDEIQGRMAKIAIVIEDGDGKPLLEIFPGVVGEGEAIRVFDMEQAFNVTFT